MKEIKILHYGLSENPGGIENVVFSWFKNKPGDIRFDFVSDCELPLAYEKEFIAGGSKILHMEKRFEHPFRRYFSFKRIIEEGDYDFFHYHAMNNDEPGLIMICNRSHKTKPIIHCHSMYRSECIPFKEKILLTEFKILSLGQKYLKLACSKEAGEVMFKGKPFLVIENGVDFSRFRFDKDNRLSVRKSFLISDNDIVIGHVGHVCFEKNYPFLIPVISKLIATNPNYRLMFIGNICYDEDIKKSLKEYDILDKTIMVGEVSDVSPFYSAMDLFFLPSISEGFPVSLVEAQVSGLPCVTSIAVTRDTKIIDDIVYLDYDADTVVESIKYLTEKTRNRTEVEVSQKLNVRNTTLKLISFYREKLNGSRI